MKCYRDAMTKIILTVAALLSLPAVARAEGSGYYDLNKVGADCADCKAAVTALNAQQKRWQAEIDAAREAANKANEACKKVQNQAGAQTPPACTDAQAKSQHLQQIYGQHQQESQDALQQAHQQIVDRVKRILPAVAKARHMGVILPVGGAFYVAPGQDVTAEVIRRLDAGEGKGEAQLKAELDKALADKERALAENAQLKASRAEKPAPAAAPVAKK